MGERLGGVGGRDQVRPADGGGPNPVQTPRRVRDSGPAHEAPSIAKAVAQIGKDDFEGAKATLLGLAQSDSNPKGLTAKQIADQLTGSKDPVVQVLKGELDKLQKAKGLWEKAKGAIVDSTGSGKRSKNLTDAVNTAKMALESSRNELHRAVLSEDAQGAVNRIRQRGALTEEKAQEMFQLDIRGQTPVHMALDKPELLRDMFLLHPDGYETALLAAGEVLTKEETSKMAKNFSSLHEEEQKRLSSVGREAMREMDTKKQKEANLRKQLEEQRAEIEGLKAELETAKNNATLIRLGRDSQ